MSLDQLLTTPVTIITPGSMTSTRYNSQLPDWTFPDEVDTIGWLTELSTTEVLDGRDTVLTGWRLFLPAGTTITAVDRVRIDGDTFDVDGQPHSATTPNGEHHIEVNLTRVVD